MDIISFAKASAAVKKLGEVSDAFTPTNLTNIEAAPQAAIDANTAKVAAELAETNAVSSAATAASEASAAQSSAITVAALANINYVTFSMDVEGDLIVGVLDTGVSTPSIVDGEFIITYP